MTLTHTRVSEDVLAALKREVVWKHGKLRGALRQEVDRALGRQMREIREQRREAEGRT